MNLTNRYSDWQENTGYSNPYSPCGQKRKPVILDTAGAGERSDNYETTEGHATGM